jgi:hypothetical protein
MPSKFYDKDFQMSARETNDEITIHKSKSSDWLNISMLTNGDQEKGITIRSEEMARQVHFMLSRVLGFRE